MAMTQEKAAFIEQLVRQGIAGAGPVQSALKERFGSGVAPSELAPLIRGKGKTKQRPARVRRRVQATRHDEAAPRAPKRRGRPRKHSPSRTTASRYLVTWKTDGDLHTLEAGSVGQAEDAVQEALDLGVAPSDVAVFEKLEVEIQMRVKI